MQLTKDAFLSEIAEARRQIRKRRKAKDIWLIHAYDRSIKYWKDQARAQKQIYKKFKEKI